MALLKEIELPTGHTGNYWRIEAIIFKPKQSIDIHIYCFKDKEMSDGGGTAVSMCQACVPVMENLEGNLVEYCYEQLKLNKEFNGAEDA